MNYLYALFGITAWVFMVSFSSNLLIANENTKLMGDIRKKVDIFSQSINIAPSGATETSQNLSSSQIADINKVQNKIPETIIKKSDTKFNSKESSFKRYEENDEDDDD